MANETILVVDDSPTIRRLVAKNLETAGYVVATAQDGQEALAVAQQAHPRLILLDFVMPRMNGFHFCRALHRIEDLSHVPVVLMSAKGDKIREKFIEQMGAVDVITKPFGPEALLAVTDHVLRKYPAGTHPFGLREANSALSMEPESEAPPEQDQQPDEDKDDLFIKMEDDDEASIAPLWDELSLAESRQARDVAEHLAARVADILSNNLPSLEQGVDLIEDTLARHLTPKALATISQIIAELEPSAGQAALAGDLSVVPLPEVLQLLELQAQTGCLEIRRDAFRVLAFFRKGRLELAQARNGRREFLLGRYALEQQAIGRTELDLLLRASHDDQSLLGQHLVQRGYLTGDELSQLLERQSSELMYEVLRWPRGRYAFRAHVLSRPALLARLGLSTGGILLEGFRRVDEWRVIEQRIEDFDVVFAREPIALQRFGRERLTAEEMHVLDAVDGRRSVRQVVDRTKMGSFLVSKLLYRLLSVNLIQRQN